MYTPRFRLVCLGLMLCALLTVACGGSSDDSRGSDGAGSSAGASGHGGSAGNGTGGSSIVNPAGSNGRDVRLGSTSVSFVALEGDSSAETQQVDVAWSALNVVYFGVAMPPGENPPSWLGTEISGKTPPVKLVLTRRGNPGPVGHYGTVLRVGTTDARGNVLDYATLAVSLDVVAAPTLSLPQLDTTWVESEGPAAMSFTIAHAPEQEVSDVTVDVPWLTLSRTADTVQIQGNAATQALAAGSYTGHVTVNLSLGGHTSSLVLPVTAAVTRALSGPAQLGLEVRGSTTEADLGALRASVSTALQPSTPLHASTDAPWLSAALGAGSNELALTVSKASLATLANGTYTASVTVSAGQSNVAPLQIPFTLRVQLPEMRFVAPVAFSDTVASDYVIARGAGLDDPTASLRLAGAAVADATLVSDTEIRFVPGERAAGEYVVDVPNALGLTRASAKLRVVDPPAFESQFLAADLGLQEDLIATSTNLFFTSMCSMCGGIVSGGTSSTLQRFAYDAGAKAWSVQSFNYPDLYTIALGPDETSLFVLTKQDLRVVDPISMQTLQTIALPSSISGSVRELGITNDGLVIIDALHKAYSLIDQRFVDLPGVGMGNGLASSRDGSRVFFGEATNSGNVPYRYYDATDGKIVLSTNCNHYSRGTYSRHAERAMTNSYLLDGSLAMLMNALPVSSHVGDLSPDGKRVYGFDAGKLRIFDVSNPQHLAELTPVDLETKDTNARSATHPHGSFVFVAAQHGLHVVDVR